MRLIPIFISLCLYTPILFGQRSLPLEVKVTNLKEKQVQLSEIMDGNIPVIICFWASWCKPCINELDALNELSENGKTRFALLQYLSKTHIDRMLKFIAQMMASLQNKEQHF